MNKCCLHKTKLEDFKKWLDSLGIAYRLGKGDYQVLQVLTKKNGWQVIFKKDYMPEHYTVNNALMPLLRKFINRKVGDGL